MSKRKRRKKEEKEVLNKGWDRDCNIYINAESRAVLGVILEWVKTLYRATETQNI